ncbi:hypothetical protein NKH71_31735 [Mesorhizobium sp. M0983]|uniref:hypothetical protein n=1 Tax=Mesorhizobium sp. M0983 TaxID=2957040 RepID=UPI00333C24EF
MSTGMSPGALRRNQNSDSRLLTQFLRESPEGPEAAATEIHRFSACGHFFASVDFEMFTTWTMPFLN